MHPDYYRLTLVNTPNVPQSEYKKAIRWQIKDLINYPLEDVAIDIFYPDETERSLKKIYVMAAQNSLLQNVTNLIQEVDLYPVAIDILEFAIRNLIMHLANSSETIGMLNVTDESCLMVLVKQQNITFVRRIPVGIKNLKNNDYSNLIAELQRSFNYCQTELKQEIPSKLLLPTQAALDKNIALNIAKILNQEIAFFSLAEVVKFKTPITQELEAKCWAAVGGALRDTT